MAAKSEENEVFEGKKSILTDRLQKREDDRLDNLNRKREEKETHTSKDENVELFTRNLQKMSSDISGALKSAYALPKEEVAEHLTDVAKDVEILKKYITDSAIYLPAYDVQKSQIIVADYQNDLQKAQKELIPKKKFAFKSRSKAVDKPELGGKFQSQPQASTSKTFNIELNETVIKDKCNETVVLYESDITGTDIAMKNVTNCKIELQGSGSSVQIDQLSNCTVMCGPISRSIFVNSCDNCTFVLACQQLRIHHTRNSAFYVHVTTRAIIEDTKNVIFGNYCFKYPKSDEHWTISGLDKKVNNWNDIDDFNYLASDAKSPNWSLVSKEQQCAMENLANLMSSPQNM